MSSTAAPAATPSPPPYASPTAAHASSSPDTIQRSAAAAATTPMNEKGPQKRRYNTSIPLPQLGRFAAPTDCPVCGERNMTRLKYRVGGYTHAIAFAAFAATIVLFWAPYVMDSCKNVDQHCGNPECGVLLATWHRAPRPGSLEVHQFT